MAKPFLSLAQDRADAGVRVLQIVERVFVGLGAEIDVEHEFGIGLARNEEEAGGVAADPVDEVAQHDVCASTLAHFDFLTVFDHQQHLVRGYSGKVLGMLMPSVFEAALQANAYASYGTVVVLNVNGAIKTAFELGKVIGYVRHKVGVVTVLLAHHSILVVLEVLECFIGGAQPQCTVGFVGEAGLHHGVNGLLHSAVGVQRALRDRSCRRQRRAA